MHLQHGHDIDKNTFFRGLTWHSAMFQRFNSLQIYFWQLRFFSLNLLQKTPTVKVHEFFQEAKVRNVLLVFE